MKRMLCIVLLCAFLFTSAYCEDGFLSFRSLSTLGNSEEAGELGLLDYSAASFQIREIVRAEEDIVSCICDATGKDRDWAQKYVERFEVPAMFLSKYQVLISGAQADDDGVRSFSDGLKESELAMASLRLDVGSIEKYAEYRADQCTYITLLDGVGLSEKRQEEMNDEILESWRGVEDAVYELADYGLEQEDVDRITEDISSISDAYLIIEYILDEKTSVDLSFGDGKSLDGVSGKNEGRNVAESKPLLYEDDVVSIRYSDIHLEKVGDSAYLKSSFLFENKTPNEIEVVCKNIIINGCAVYLSKFVDIPSDCVYIHEWTSDADTFLQYGIEDIDTVSISFNVDNGENIRSDTVSVSG